MAAKDRLPRSSAPDVRAAKKATPTPAPVQRTPTDRTALTPQNIQALQRTIGNRAVQRLLAKSERPAAPNAMPAEVQGKMESSFQTDFSEVRVHPDSARVSEVGATAFTQGNDIHFAPGAYQPTSDAGQALLGHELSHVVQQRAGRVQPTGAINGTSYNDAPALEREADHSGALAARGETVQMVGQGNTGGGAPVQQYFWGEAAIIAAGAAVGLAASSITPLIAAFGLAAVGRYLFSHKRQGTEGLSAEQMRKDLEAIVPDDPAPMKVDASTTPIGPLDTIVRGKKIPDVPSAIDKTPPQEVAAKKAPMADLPIPKAKNVSQPDEDIAKKGASDEKPKQVQVAETPIMSEAERKAQEIAQAKQRRIVERAQEIRTRYVNYRLQMAAAVATFPDMDAKRREVEGYLEFYGSDLELLAYDGRTVQPEWNAFTAQRAANQLELDHQHGRRIFIHNSELEDIRDRTDTIEQRMNNFGGGRTSPYIKGVLHERITEGRAYNKNIIYSWQGNNLYLHGVVLYHLDSTMSGSQKTESAEIEGRGATPANFTEVRYRGGQYVAI